MYAAVTGHMFLLCIGFGFCCCSPMFSFSVYSNIMFRTKEVIVE